MASLESLVGTAKKSVSGRDYFRNLVYGTAIITSALGLSCTETKRFATPNSPTTVIEIPNPDAEPYIRIIEPNGNASLEMGSSQDFLWESSLPANSLIELNLIDDRGNSTNVGKSINDGKETIIIPRAGPGMYKAEAASVHENRIISDLSDDYFMITYPREAPQAVELLAFGDAVDLDRLDISQRIRALADRFPSAQIAWLGDIQYPNGSYEQFMRGFHPIHGSLKSRSIVVPGNHEYETAGAAGYFAYFADLPFLNNLFRSQDIIQLGQFYSLKYGNWWIYALNSSNNGSPVPLGRNSFQYKWLENELNVNISECSIFMIHHPYVTHGIYTGQADNQRDLIQLIYDAGGDAILAAHDHNQQVSVKLDPNKMPDAKGIQHFVSGGGGHSRLYPVSPSPNLLYSSMTHGFFVFTLGQGFYDFRFVDLNGNIRYSGREMCH